MTTTSATVYPRLKTYAQISKDDKYSNYSTVLGTDSLPSSLLFCLLKILFVIMSLQRVAGMSYNFDNSSHPLQ
jgi:hypothetical protein